MNKAQLPVTHERLRFYLAAGYALFILYGSLSPFTGWQDQGLNFLEVMSVPLHLQYTWFDFTINLLAYLPLGLLLGLSFHTRLVATWCVLLTLLCAMGFSATMEYAQMYLPSRISSNLDFVANSLGALTGILLVVIMTTRTALIARLQVHRTHFFIAGNATNFGLALVALWMFAQINPLLPLLGHVFPRDVAHLPLATTAPAPFQWLDSIAVLINLLMLGLLLLSLLNQQRHLLATLMLVLCAVVFAKFITAAILLKSWALFLWINSEALLGICAGVFFLMLMSKHWQRKFILWGAASAALDYALLTNWILDNSMPFAIRRLYQLQYGHLFNYNQLSQAVTYIFPVLLLIYLWRSR
ncbi:MAG: VanZ family protein [Candidatus Nitrotoga sp.]